MWVCHVTDYCIALESVGYVCAEMQYSYMQKRIHTHRRTQDCSLHFTLPSVGECFQVGGVSLC